MTVVWLLLMLASGVGLVVGLKFHRQSRGIGEPITIVSLVLAAVAVAFFLFGQGGNHRARGRAIEQREYAYSRVGTEYLGAYLAKKYPDKKILVIEPFPFQMMPERRELMIQGVKQGLGDAMAAVEFVPAPLPPKIDAKQEQWSGDWGDLPQLESWFHAAYMDKLLVTHARDKDLVVSLIGMPHDFQKMQFWKVKNRPKIASWYGPVVPMQKRLSEGDIVAVVANSTTPVFDEEMPPSDLDAAFKKRYVLLTPGRPTR